ncbi:MAG: hypothetical protein J2P57_02140 [Acidimicrobiaceae bacterium]|nr:hypothetical protein [Acidimicrobiaceae bacterium]
MSSRGSAALVVGVWGAMNLVLTLVLFAFSSPTRGLALSIFSVSVAMLAVLAVLVATSTDRRIRRAAGTDAARSGAPGLAVAGAALAGGLAWIFGVWAAYFALPLLAYAVTKVAGERRQRSGPR